MIKYIIPLFIIFLSSCKFEKSKVSDSNAEIDSTKFYFDKYLTALEERGISYPIPFRFFIQKPYSNEKDLKTPFIDELKEAIINLNYGNKYEDSFYNNINEPNLRKVIKHGETIFRFTYEPSREYYRYTFRISKLLNQSSKNYNYNLIVKRFNNPTFIDLNKDTTIIAFEKEITEAEFNKFNELVDKSLFWSLGLSEREGYDGSYWTLEGVIRNRRGYSPKLTYNVFQIWAPKEGCFKDACTYLIKLYGKDIGPIY